MSELYAVIPFSEVVIGMPREELDNYLASLSLSRPPHIDRSRNPTLREIENAVNQFHCDTFITEFCFVENIRNCEVWSQMIVRQPKPPHWWMDVSILETPADKDSPCHIYICGKPEMNYLFLEKLAHSCGPLFSIVNGEYGAAIFHYKDSAADPPPSYCSGHWKSEEGTD